MAENFFCSWLGQVRRKNILTDSKVDEEEAERKTRKIQIERKTRYKQESRLLELEIKRQTDRREKSK